MIAITDASKKRIENYQILKNLGEGAFGAVKLAIDLETKKEVAIKAVNMDQTLEMNKLKHIFREKELLYELKHPNIIELIGTTKDLVNLYFVFECCKNGTLDDLIKKYRGLPVDVVKVMFA